MAQQVGSLRLRLKEIEARNANEASEERRIDPDDGQLCTLREFQRKYDGCYNEKELLEFFKSYCLSSPATALKAGEVCGHPIQTAEGGARHFSFLQDLAEPLKNVVVTAYASRGKLAQDVKSYVYVSGKTVVSMPGRVSNVVHNPRIHAVLREEEDPGALAAVVCGTGGALCVGSIGAVVGISLGGVVGLLLGILPALFTLGLSLPVGLLMGSMGGLCGGLVVGSSVGFMGGAASGCTIAYYRVEIRRTANGIAARVDYAYDKLVRQPTLKVKSVARSICDKARRSTAYTKECVVALVSSRHAQVTAASGAMGAAALGTAGAAGGALAGGTSGALIGLVPAIFTFGLSIPAGAAVGGGMGFFLGGALGASSGFVGGVTAGYTGYKYRDVPGRAITFAGDKWDGFRGRPLRNRSSSGGTEDTVSE